DRCDYAHAHGKAFRSVRSHDQGLSPGSFATGCYPENLTEETTMTRMTAAQAAVLVMEKEGVTSAFGVPGAAINPLYAALRSRNSIKHVLARHVEGASQ